MRSSQLNLSKYNTDKIAHDFLTVYDPFFEPLFEKKIALLEIGVYEGGSTLLWRDYFPFGTIAGVDTSLPKGWQPTERIRLFEGSQDDTKFLSDVAYQIAPGGFDIIIDDASHIGSLTKVAFWHLFDNHLKPGGLYVIEDWGTGYWDDWPDGKCLDFETYSSGTPVNKSLWQRIVKRFHSKKPSWPSHSYGMVGLIKQLVDEQAAKDVTRRSVKDDNASKRASKFENMVITPSIVFIKKAALPPK